MPRTPPWLQSILEEHFEELQMLWELRQSAIRDPDYLLEDVAELDERIEAHVDGLVLGEQHARPILEEGIGGDEASVVFAAAYVLLRLQDQAAADLVMETLTHAQGEQIDGVRQAFTHGPLDLVNDCLKELYESGPSHLAAVVAEIYASRGRLQPDARRLLEFYEDEEPTIRRAAWRITALVGTERKSYIDATT